MNVAEIKERFRRVLPSCDFCSLRIVDQRDEFLAVRQNVPEPSRLSRDLGGMITVIDGGGLGYAATPDLSAAGLRRAADRACEWAALSAGRGVFDFGTVALPHPRGDYATPVKQPWDAVSLSDKLALLVRVCEALKTDDRIVDWDSSLWHTQVDSLYLTNEGGEVRQSFCYVSPSLAATASQGVRSQRRSLGSQRGQVRQSGLEILADNEFEQAPPRVAEQALELLQAPNCPSDRVDLLLMPDQLFLQIHESVGHPLELDRILGDERNYAGTSFVSLDMIGTYCYGSELMNITFAPDVAEEFASYAYDDEGMRAERAHLVERGVLKRALGGITSQTRAGVPGVACARACSWTRPAIDRMANLNLEPGDSSLEEMIGAVERGILMEANCSWSIDDSRNKFQFGCERGQLIEDGELTTVVRNPNYRGISATFWRNLKMVGNGELMQCLGTPCCGKGEPNQGLKVGHACPPALFAEVDVFGGVSEDGN